MEKVNSIFVYFKSASVSGHLSIKYIYDITQDRVILL